MVGNRGSDVDKPENIASRRVSLVLIKRDLVLIKRGVSRTFFLLFNFFDQVYSIFYYNLEFSEEVKIAFLLRELILKLKKCHSKK